MKSHPTLRSQGTLTPICVTSHLQCRHCTVLEHLVAAPLAGLEGLLRTQPAQFGDDP